MAKSTRNEFEFMSMVLDALGVEYEEADIKQRERWRGKVLDGWGVDYVVDDLKQFARWRKKCLEGLAKNSGGGGDFTTAQVTITNNSTDSTMVVCPNIVEDNGGIALGRANLSVDETKTVTIVLYKGTGYILVTGGQVAGCQGDVTADGINGAIVTGDGSFNVIGGIS